MVWDSDARYTYYKHGPLARTQLGTASVQGTDFAYTLQGWVKGVNSSILQPTNDIGKDGNSLYNRVSTDAYSYSLNYYNGDYQPIGGNQANNFLADASKVTATDSPDLFNGNIKSMATTLLYGTLYGTMYGTSVPYQASPQLTTYQYDQLNRITQMKAYQGITNNAWNAGGTANYFSTFTYDLNGNILSKNRNDDQGNPSDQLAYTYQTTANYSRNTNRLDHVTDNVATPTVNTDIESQSAGNYTYDAIGNLIGDASEGITNIDWTVYGKVRSVTRASTSTLAGIEFAYDAAGHRIAKIVKPAGSTAANWDVTLYAYDASGNTMATYDLNSVGYSLNDQYIYGSSRVGVATRAEILTATGFIGNTGSCAGRPSCTTCYESGDKKYELTNHLGNVLAVISDRRVYTVTGSLTNTVAGINATTPGTSFLTNIGYAIPDILATNDYYPFGELMPGRTYNSTDFRYGFNGKEKDDELNGSVGTSYDFGARMYDPRTGRLNALDKYSKSYPSYSNYSMSLNDPIYFTDNDGNVITDRAGNVVTINFDKDGKLIPTFSDGTTEQNKKFFNSYTKPVLEKLYNRKLGKELVEHLRNHELKFNIEDQKYSVDFLAEENSGIRYDNETKTYMIDLQPQGEAKKDLGEFYYVVIRLEKGHINPNRNPNTEGNLDKKNNEIKTADEYLEIYQPLLNQAVIDRYNFRKQNEKPNLDESLFYPITDINGENKDEGIPGDERLVNEGKKIEPNEEVNTLMKTYRNVKAKKSKTVYK